MLYFGDHLIRFTIFLFMVNATAKITTINVKDIDEQSVDMKPKHTIHQYEILLDLSQPLRVIYVEDIAVKHVAKTNPNCNHHMNKNVLHNERHYPMCFD